MLENLENRSEIISEVQNPQDGSVSTFRNKKTPFKVSVTFDFCKQIVTLKFDSQIVNQKRFKSNDLNTSSFWKESCIEYKIDKDTKWIFSWREWGDLTQYFYLDKTTQIKSNEQGKSINTTYIDIELAKWSHISNPCIGTTQNDGVHQVYYYEKQFQEIDYLYFEVVGRPGKNWNTNNSIIGGSEW